LLKEVSSFNPDVVYVQNVSDPNLLEELAKVRPMVKFVHDHRVYCPGNSKMWFASNRICSVATSWRCGWYAYRERCMTRRPKKLVEDILRRQGWLVTLKKLPKVLCNSNYVRERLLQNGLTAGKVEVNALFPGGVATGPRQTGGQAAAESVPEILFVGRVFVEKGVEYLLQAAALIKNMPFRVVVVGEGWAEERCKALAKDLALGERVNFTGFLPRAEIDSHYARCRLLVLPSVWPEPFGMVGLEALAHGKPVVAFAVGGLADWLKDGEVGFLVERGNVEKLAERMAQLLTDDGLAGRMGEAGRRLVQERFTLERHLEQLLSVFKRLVV
jgi:glycosyltransferase involved in cell wall biosynthesis